MRRSVFVLLNQSRELHPGEVCFFFLLFFRISGDKCNVHNCERYRCLVYINPTVIRSTFFKSQNILFFFNRTFFERFGLRRKKKKSFLRLVNSDKEVSEEVMYIFMYSQICIKVLQLFKKYIDSNSTFSRNSSFHRYILDIFNS